MAQSALPAVGAEALVGVESVDAGPSVATGVAGTVIDVCWWEGGQSGDQYTVTARSPEGTSKIMHRRETIIRHMAHYESLLSH